MNDPANLQLSAEEMRLVSDPGWILTKNSIMGKAVAMLGGLSGDYREIWGNGGSNAGIGGNAGSAGFASIRPGDPKVSRGENYRGLPWVMLDFPRVWGREDVLAIRTMFLWGHGFSVMLHLKGRFLRVYLPVIERRRVELAAAGFFVSVHEDEWRHEHTPEVFAPMDEVVGMARGSGAEGRWREREFLKLSAAVRLDRWSGAPGRLGELFGLLVSLLREGE